jgi:hypothetical protein
MVSIHGLPTVDWLTQPVQRGGFSHLPYQPAAKQQMATKAKVDLDKLVMNFLTVRRHRCHTVPAQQSRRTPPEKYDGAHSNRPVGRTVAQVLCFGICVALIISNETDCTLLVPVA